MDYNNEFVDLDGITNSEFKQQIKSWIEEKGIHENLQLQMKKGLIEQISRTALGRKMSLKLQTQQGIVLSPLILVLNTLVAEFLYTQNCHFSLSVFSNEVPFKNTLPDFTKTSHFRLQRKELKEIFEALGIEQYSSFIEKYESKTTTDNSKSLLYIIFKALLASVKSYEDKTTLLQKQETERDAHKSQLEGLEIEKLHRNVGKMLHRIKEVSKGIVRVEKLQSQDQPDPDSHKEETHSLGRCTANVQQLISRLENCSASFESIIEKLQLLSEQKTVISEKFPIDIKQSTEKSYTDFLNELKNTIYGKKYVAKLQKQILKLMEKEKSIIEAKCMEKLHQVELDYKTKIESVLSERIKEIDIRHSPTTSINQLVQTEENVRFMKKIDEKLDMLYQHEKNINEKLTALKNNLQQHELRDNQKPVNQTQKSVETKEKRLSELQNMERELLATFEDETQAIVQNAKTTIGQLENESNRINLSFQQYLNKQKEDKKTLNNEKVQIWQKYNDEKLELIQRELLDINGSKQDKVPLLKEIVASSSIDSPELNIFKNPFKNFDPRKYLRIQKGSNICNPKPLNAVDVAVNTSFETNSPSITVTVKETSESINQSKKDSWQSNTEKPVLSKSYSVEQQQSVTSYYVNEPKKSIETESKLSKLLATDTKNLKKSIELNLQKLDEISKTYTKSSTASSEKQGNTYNVKPTIETEKVISKASLDDLSSADEMRLSDGNSLSVENPEPRINKDIANLNTTRELLDFEKSSFPIERRNNKFEKVNINAEEINSSEHISIGFLSDSDITGDSKSVHVSGDNSNGRIEEISTNQRSISNNSWG
ncbi:centriole and centriolar satellite protein OFD1 [Malaya genurostris]|uniref:centriole and centriolar satellite protein OFD1 n=1 Tax=Malaya genurostris TaxID=325434 RepID=UPI0026F39B49|nr:centriole and centriolar satellite protein OFD1 [Malaya genurostris]